MSDVIPRPVVLAVLDGFGENPDPSQNAVAAAKMPSLSALKARFPHGTLRTSGLDVGLPEGQMGNSEVGHMNIGSGRVLMQELPRIDDAIKTGALAANMVLQEFIAKLKASKGVCHLMGLLSPGGVHSHQHHMAELAKLVSASGVPVKIHAFLDGRDTPPKSAQEYVAQFKQEFPAADFVTVGGRYFAMDRDKRWDRIETALQALMNGNGIRHKQVETAIDLSYVLGKTDEFITPTVLGTYTGMKDGDGLLMANFRADRARQIMQALIDPQFKAFFRYKVEFAAAIGMVDYSADLAPLMQPMFRPEPLKNILGEVIAARGLKQLHIAETEKYAHVTFFLNGGREENFAGEERILVPSPKVATYDLKPEMSAVEVTDKLVAAINAGTFDFIVVNYANCDMVGHTGQMEAATRAVEVVDTCIGRVWAAVEAVNGALLVTADHGNAEQMFDAETGQPHTAHTLNAVPVILAGKGLEGKALAVKEGRLADIAPTILNLMHIPQPAEMTGNPLIRLYTPTAEELVAAAPQPPNPQPVAASAPEPVKPSIPQAVQLPPVQVMSPVQAAASSEPAPSKGEAHPGVNAEPLQSPSAQHMHDGNPPVSTPSMPAAIPPAAPSTPAPAVEAVRAEFVPLQPAASAPPLMQPAAAPVDLLRAVPVLPPVPASAPAQPIEPPAAPQAAESSAPQAEGEFSLADQISRIAKEIEERLKSGAPADASAGQASAPASSEAPQEKPLPRAGNE